MLPATACCSQVSILISRHADSHTAGVRAAYIPIRSCTDAMPVTVVHTHHKGKVLVVEVRHYCMVMSWVG